MKIMMGLTGSLLLLVAISCGSSTDPEGKQDKSIIKRELLNVDTTKTEVVLNEGRIYFELEYVGYSEYIARWGESSNALFQDTIKILESGNPKMMALESSGIYISQGCGTACSFAYVLPFRTDAKVKYYLYPLAIDLKNNLIAYNGEETESLAVVESYLTGESELIKADFLPGPYPGYSIDSIFLSGEKMFIEWKSSNGKLQQKQFEITIK
ncbi:hypothetical protein JMN32_15155 [Fulvivirga sp. 29W222]|uniref:Uncharacterized protein n=1 Tax=Fulvivirga marina TaxID=2494733 RepID=A0A937FX18_9BACT|nr:hypothetical protein [Fulvivirga marina]MBL6447654.1 hypothetical protein [Fulvivirga marina]